MRCLRSICGVMMVGATAAAQPAFLEEPVWVDPGMYDAPPPRRDPAEVLAALEALGGEPASPEPGSPGEVFDAWRSAVTQHAATRANLIAELERAGYAGAEMPRLLRERVRALRQVLNAAYPPMNLWSAALWEMAERHANTPEGAAAELASKANALHVISFESMGVSAEALHRIAELELAAVPAIGAENAGETLRKALRHQPREVVQRWQAWMIEHLPESSAARRWAETSGRYGQPARVVAVGLDGIAIDTVAWAGDVILLDFWGTWCGPCVAEMPAIAAMRRELGPRGLRVLGISFDDPDRARRWLAEHPAYDWPQVAGSVPNPLRPSEYANPVVEAFGVTAFPTVLLIDRRGNLRPGGRGEALRTAVEALLAEPR